MITTAGIQSSDFYQLFHSTDDDDAALFIPTSSAAEIPSDDPAHFPPSSPSDHVSSIFSHTDGIYSGPMSRFSSPESPKSGLELNMLVDSEEKELPLSQDPLLLKSPAPGGLSSVQQYNSSLDDSGNVSLETMEPANAASPRRALSPLPVPLQGHDEINSQDDVDHLADGLMHLSPYKGSRYSSPLSPSPPAASNSPSRHTPSSSPPPQPPSPPPYVPPEDPVIPPDPLENQPRYALRQRGARQLNPYLYDKAEYHNALKNNPDAIVKMKSPRRGEHRHEHYLEEGEGETQQQEYDAAYDSPGGRRKQRRTTRSRSKSRASERSDVAELGLLDDLSSSDDDEIDATRKEARRFERERERKAREERLKVAREKRDAHKKKRSFPLSKRFLDSERDKSGSDRRSSPNVRPLATAHPIYSHAHN